MKEIMQSIMPQLDKFTYFTQFFWASYFLFTFYIAIRKKVFFRFNLGEKLYFFYLNSQPCQRVVFYLKWGFLFFLVVRGSALLYHNLQMVFGKNTIFCISPSEMALLNHYLDQPNQDPEWVQYVRDCLGTTSPYLRQYDIMVRNFLDYYHCETTREQISSMYQIIFYGREAPQFFIEPIDLDGIIRLYLENIEFNPPALTKVLSSLIQERENSPFYTDVQTTQAKHFQGFRNLRETAELDRLHRNNMYKEYQILEAKIPLLESENASLRARLFSKR